MNDDDDGPATTRITRWFEPDGPMRQRVVCDACNWRGPLRTGNDWQLADLDYDRHDARHQRGAEQ
jgi:hypothetical protein